MHSSVASVRYKLGIGGAECPSGDLERGSALDKMSRIDPQLLDIMECPVGHVPLVQAGDWLYSTDPKTRRKYPIRDGIPVMLVEESEVADTAEFERVMTEAKQRPGSGTGR